MEVSVQPHVPAAFSSGRKTPFPTELEGGSATGLGLDFFGEEKTLASARIQTSDRPTSSLVTILSCTSLPHEVFHYDGTGLRFYTFYWHGNFCFLDHRFDAGFGALSCAQCKIVYAYLIRVQCVGLRHVLNSSSAWFGNPDSIRWRV